MVVVWSWRSGRGYVERCFDATGWTCPNASANSRNRCREPPEHSWRPDVDRRPGGSKGVSNSQALRGWKSRVADQPNMAIGTNRTDEVASQAVKASKVSDGEEAPWARQVQRSRKARTSQRQLAYTVGSQEIEGCGGLSAAGHRMVGPPSSWSSRDQEDASWQPRSVDHLTVLRRSVSANSCLFGLLRRSVMLA